MHEPDPYRPPAARIETRLAHEHAAAGRWRRFFNWAIDHAVLKVFWWVVGMSYVAWCAFRGDDPRDAVWRYEHLSFGWRYACGLVATATYYLLMEEITSDELGALVYVDREPFQVVYHGPQTSAELARIREFQWTTAGRNVVGYGHPYNLFRCEAT